MSRLKDKVAVITGGNSGIGFGIAEQPIRQRLKSLFPRNKLKQ
jgi:NAD(P)-dependent dehydrogenase (short-subunit alcohol dehydrogenase family)